MPSGSVKFDSEEPTGDLEPSTKSSNLKWGILGAVLLIIVAAGIGIGLGVGLKDDDDDVTTTEPTDPTVTTTVMTTTPHAPLTEDNRINCVPEPLNETVGVTEAECHQRGCVWDPESTNIVCYLPQNIGYRAFNSETTPNGIKVNLQLPVSLMRQYYSTPIRYLTFDLQEIDDNILRFKIYDSINARYEVPVPLYTDSTGARSPRYKVEFEGLDNEEEMFSFKIIRKSTNEIIWDTTIGGLIFEDQFIQITTRLTSENLYGFGQHRKETFKHDLNYKTWPMFAKDTWQGDYMNLYAHHPMYMAVEDDGNAHGVFLLNSNAMEVELMPHALVWRTIGGILDFSIFLGPDPNSVIQQYTQVVGRPVMVPMWGLGFQMSRWGYQNLSELSGVVNDTKDADIPLDLQYADIDYMYDRRDFTLDKDNFGELPDYIEHLQEEEKMRFVIILDPAIISNVTGYLPYENGTADDVWVKWPPGMNPDYQESGDYLLGYVWPTGKTVYPDFLNSRTQEWWKSFIIKEHDRLRFDGLWIDMNEPTCFNTNDIKPWNWPDYAEPYWSLKCPNESTLELPPYKTTALWAKNWDHVGPVLLSDNTICMDSLHDDGKYRHYDVHSLYGWSQTPSTLEAAREATGERSMVFSRSTYAGSGHYGGSWTGDNTSKWPDMKSSIVALFEYNMFGIPYIGADICGFWDDATAEMCQRWHQLGAFYPFARNHNSEHGTDQHPTVFGEEVAANVARYMKIRYRMLPYLYTLMHMAHKDGSTVVRPLFFKFPKDPLTWDVDDQLMWGDALMVAPVLTESAEEVDVFFPEEGVWYDYFDGAYIDNKNGQLEHTISAPLEDLAMFTVGGTIIPTWECPEKATTLKCNDMGKLGLIVSLNDQSMEAYAQGYLFWDDGYSLDTYENGNYYDAKLKYDHNTVYILSSNTGYDMSGFHLNSIDLVGLAWEPKYFRVNGVVITPDVTWNGDTMKAVITSIDHSLTNDMVFEFSGYPFPTEEVLSRIDCFPELDNINVTEAECSARNCLYDYSFDNPGVPVCFYNDTDDTFGYTLDNCTADALGTDCTLVARSPSGTYGENLSPITLRVEELTDHSLHVKFDYPNRFEPPIELHTRRDERAEFPLYDVEINNTADGVFYLSITRKSTGKILFDTRLGPLVISDKFLEISTTLPSEYVYGVGENPHYTFKHNMMYQTWPLWARDQAPGWGHYSNMYGVHPYYTVMEGDGNAHSVFLKNANAMEVKMLPNPGLTWRSIGGLLDFYFFFGPEPEQVVQQYLSVIGNPYFPPYWSLGFQLCRYGYNHIANLTAAINRTREAEIPLDGFYGDIDHMDERKDFTIDEVNFAGLPEYVNSLQADGLHFTIILDPALISNETDYEPYENGLLRDVYIKWPTGTSPDYEEHNNDNMLGYVWPRGKTVFPDFFKARTEEWWHDEIVKHHAVINFDALWIDMNEPANFGTNDERPFNWPDDALPYWSLKCNESELDDPPYKPKAVYGERISEKTLCMVGEQGENQELDHYDVHSLYGWSQTRSTLDALRDATKKRGLVVSRSTYPTSGTMSGHWTGDNNSDWPHLHISIIGLLEFNMFGIPYVGADICGFFGDTTPELCERWQQLGAFYTYSRNHNTLGAIDQDPAVFGVEVASSTKKALDIRYTLLPYLYTLFYHARINGDTVLRPVMHEFPLDLSTYNVDYEFLWGSAFLICPVIFKGDLSTFCYLPNDVWYDWYTGAPVERLGHILVNAPLDHIPLFVRGGFILPTQQPDVNTVHSRKQPFGLVVAIGQNGLANGDLFWDDGDSIDTIDSLKYYHATFELLREMSNDERAQLARRFSHLRVSQESEYGAVRMEIQRPFDEEMQSLYMNKMRVLGISTEPDLVLVQSIVHTDYIYYSKAKELYIYNLELPMNTDFVVQWL